VTEPTPPETPPPRTGGWVRARRGALGVTGLVAAVFAVAGGLAVSPLLVAGGVAATAAAGAGVWHLPRIRKHFASPNGRSRTTRTRTVTRKTSGGGPGRKKLLGAGGSKAFKGRSGGGRSGGGKAFKGLGRSRSGGSGGAKGKGLGLGKRSGKSGGTGGRKP
jgi:hypothetical protein